MKARFLLLLLLPVCMWATSHAQDKMTPVVFNDELVKVTGTLYKLGTDWGTKFAAINAGDKNFSQLTAIREQLTDFISAQSDIIKQLPNTGKGAEAFKKAMQDFLAFESEMITSGFVPIERLDKEQHGRRSVKSDGEGLRNSHPGREKPWIRCIRPRINTQPTII